jgi:hypothetical protein
MKKLERYKGINLDKVAFERNYEREIANLPKKIINYTIDISKYSGHNELDIKDSPNRYARLFE